MGGKHKKDSKNNRRKYRKYTEKLNPESWAIYEIVPKKHRILELNNEKLILQAKGCNYPVWDRYRPHFREDSYITYISKEELANLKVAAL